MSWFSDSLEKLFKREVEPTSFSSMFQRMDVDAFFGQLNNLWSPDEMIRKMGGYNNLDRLYKDQDIYAAIDKRVAALLDTRLVIEGKDEKLVSFFEEQLRPHERQLKQDFWWTIYNGWGVEQILYNPNRSGEVTGFKKEEFWRFEPQADLIHVKLINGFNMNNQIMPYGKWVLTTNNGTSSNPAGDAMAARLVMPYIFKCNGWDLWMDFAKRFANGFMHAAIEDASQADQVRAALEKAGKSSIIVTDKNSTLTLHQASRDSSIYTAIHDKTVASINKVILGETQTSDIGTNGGYASASVHNEVRLEKNKADIDLVETAINEVILQIALVNGFIPDASYANDLPKAKLVYDPTFNMELADRDVKLYSLGVRFEKDYFVENYGIPEDQFKIEAASAAPTWGFEVESPKNGTVSLSSNPNRSLYLSPEQAREFIGVPKHSCKFSIGQKASRTDAEKEEITQLLSRNGTPPLDTEDLIAAIMTAESSTDLDEKLAALFDTRNNGFVDDMSQGLYLAAARGAMVGNPEVIKNEEE